LWERGWKVGKLEGWKVRLVVLVVLVVLVSDLEKNCISCTGCIGYRCGKKLD